MKVGIAGFAGSGKSTAFQWLTGARPDPARSQVGQVGMAKVPDERLDWLSAQFKPKKTTPAEIAFLDTPGLLPTERRDNPRRLAILRDAGGLLVVLNGFSEGDPAVGEPLPADLLALAPDAIRAPVKLEIELAELPDADRQAFMQDLGLTGL